MIKLTPITKPIELTKEKVKELTKLFINEEKRVWNKPYIKDALLKMSHNKCAYCETNIIEESKYLEVEHFHPKGIYPNEVVKWSNLLPACKRCNSNKGEHDTKEFPIINPVKDIPKEHLFFKNYRICGKTELGKLTVSSNVLYLNDTRRLTTPRFKIGFKIQDEFEELHEQTKDYVNKIKYTNRQKNKITSKLHNLLNEAIPNSEYSAVSASIILYDSEYSKIKELFKSNSLWNTEYENLENQVKFCALEIR